MDMWCLYATGREFWDRAMRVVMDQTPPPNRNQPPTGTATPPPNRNQPPTGTTTPPVPIRHQRYDADTQTFVFVIPGQAPRFVELEDLPGVITVNGIRYRLLKPDVVRGL